MKKKTTFPLYLKILVGLVAGFVWGIINKESGLSPDLTVVYIKPIGTIFLELLKYIALPLVLVSVTVGITNLEGISKLSRLGGKTILIYTLTTIIAIVIGIVIVDILQPGKAIGEDTRNQLLEIYKVEAQQQHEKVIAYKTMSAWERFVDGFPNNIVSKMLYFVIFALVAGVILVVFEGKKVKPIVNWLNKANDFILKLVEYIMYLAPFGVFALIASLVVETHSHDLLFALLQYSFTVLLGLVMMTFGVYPLMLKYFSNIPIRQFYEAMRPAQLLAFSSSSSSATLPVTMQQCERRLKLPEKVTSFVLPLGSTINMDGTSLYQAVAAIFIAQVYGMDLSLMQQLGIVFTALIASVGSAGVPGAGMIMLGIVLQSENIPMEGIALIMAPDRILDMCRTVVNVTGDATVTAVIAKTEKS